jgi:putative ribosome biogenesis GTPase RsgA
MDINTLLTERMNFNNSLFSMSFPDIVEYIEKNPNQIVNVDWDLFTNPSIRISKNIDDYPEIILKHLNWPWKFNIKQIQTELSRKISELNRLVGKSTYDKPNNENWLDKILVSMEKLCESQNKQNMVYLNKIQEEIDKEEKEEKEESYVESVVKAIMTEEMPPEKVNFSVDNNPKNFKFEDEEDPQ